MHTRKLRNYKSEITALADLCLPPISKDKDFGTFYKSCDNSMAPGQLQYSQLFLESLRGSTMVTPMLIPKGKTVYLLCHFASPIKTLGLPFPDRSGASSWLGHTG